VITGTGVNVEYKYDALGRRIEKAVKDPIRTAVTRFVLSGRQVIEERDENNRLTTRYAYGNGIDEPVEIEKDIDGDGTLESYIPMQNTNGSVMGIADSSGKLKEKVNYSAYGLPTFIYDHEPPRVDQVRVASGKVYIRFSEPVDEAKARGAIKVKSGVDVLSGSFAFGEKNRRVIFTPSSALPRNELLTVLVTTGLEDLFGNKLLDEFSQDFTFVGENVIIYDRTAPEVEVVKMIENEFFVEFSEEIHPGTIADSINITTLQETLTVATFWKEALLKSRELMADQEAAGSLPRPKTITELYKKYKAKGLKGEDIWNAIYNGAIKSNPKVDKAMRVQMVLHYLFFANILTANGN